MQDEDPGLGREPTEFVTGGIDQACVGLTEDHVNQRQALNPIRCGRDFQNGQRKAVVPFLTGFKTPRTLFISRT